MLEVNLCSHLLFLDSTLHFPSNRPQTAVLEMILGEEKEDSIQECETPLPVIPNTVRRTHVVTFMRRLSS